MPTKKKRASFSKSPHIAVQAVVTSLEDEHEIEEKNQPKIASISSVSSMPTAEKHIEKITAAEEAVSEASLEEMLANDAQESGLAIKNVWLYRLGVIVAGGISICALIIYIAYAKQTSVPKNAVVLPQTPTPIPTAAVDIKTITIEVLNGSGVSGKAAKTADILKNKGYTITSTGNSKKIPVSTVFFSSSLSDQAKSMLLLDLQSVGVSSVSAESIASSASARVILGIK